MKVFWYKMQLCFSVRQKRKKVPFKAVLGDPE